MRILKFLLVTFLLFNLYSLIATERLRNKLANNAYITEVLKAEMSSMKIRLSKSDSLNEIYYNILGQKIEENIDLYSKDLLPCSFATIQNTKNALVVWMNNEETNSSLLDFFSKFYIINREKINILLIISTNNLLTKKYFADNLSLELPLFFVLEKDTPEFLKGRTIVFYNRSNFIIESPYIIDKSSLSGINLYLSSMKRFLL